VSAIITAAAILLGAHGVCLEADSYPAPRPGEIRGYVSIDRCAIPYTAHISAQAVRTMVAHSRRGL
jgi:hypothetical protein